MNEQERLERLSQALDGLIAGKAPESTGDAEVDRLVDVASGLSGLPDPGFKAQLKAELCPRDRWFSWIGRGAMTAKLRQIYRGPLVRVPIAAVAVALTVAAFLGVMLLVERGQEAQPIDGYVALVPTSLGSGQQATISLSVRRQKLAGGDATVALVTKARPSSRPALASAARQHRIRGA
jgi:hypothetical protein